MFYSMDEPEFWGRDTKRMETIAEQGGLDGISIANFVLGKPEDNAPAATFLRMSPGYMLPRHAHDCYRMEIVLDGSFTVGDRTYEAGTIMTSEPGVSYGPHIAGPDGCTTIEIFSNFKGSHTTLMETPSGVVECDLRSAEGARRMVEFVQQQRAALNA